MSVSKRSSILNAYLSFFLLGLCSMLIHSVINLESYIFLRLFGNTVYDAQGTCFFLRRFHYLVGIVVFIVCIISNYYNCFIGNVLLFAGYLFNALYMYLISNGFFAFSRFTAINILILSVISHFLLSSSISYILDPSTYNNDNSLRITVLICGCFASGPFLRLTLGMDVDPVSFIEDFNVATQLFCRISVAFAIISAISCISINNTIIEFPIHPSHSRPPVSLLNTLYGKYGWIFVISCLCMSYTPMYNNFAVIINSFDSVNLGYFHYYISLLIGFIAFIIFYNKWLYFDREDNRFKILNFNVELSPDGTPLSSLPLRQYTTDFSLSESPEMLSKLVCSRLLRPVQPWTCLPYDSTYTRWEKLDNLDNNTMYRVLSLLYGNNDEFPCFDENQEASLVSGQKVTLLWILSSYIRGCDSMCNSLDGEKSKGSVSCTATRSPEINGNCHSLQSLKTKLSNCKCDVCKGLEKDITTRSQCCNTNDPTNFIQHTLKHCKKEAEDLISDINAVFTDLNPTDDVDSIIKEFLLRVLALILYKRIIDEFLLLRDNVHKIIDRVMGFCRAFICSCINNGKRCSTEDRCICTIFSKLCKSAVLLHEKYCDTIDVINGNSDKDLSTVMPSLSSIRSVILLSTYFNDVVQAYCLSPVSLDTNDVVYRNDPICSCLTALCDNADKLKKLLEDVCKTETAAKTSATCTCASDKCCCCEECKAEQGKSCSCGTDETPKCNLCKVAKLICCLCNDKTPCTSCLQQLSSAVEALNAETLNSTRAGCCSESCKCMCCTTSRTIKLQIRSPLQIYSGKLDDIVTRLLEAVEDNSESDVILSDIISLLLRNVANNKLTVMEEFKYNVMKREFCLNGEICNKEGKNLECNNCKSVKSEDCCSLSAGSDIASSENGKCSVDNTSTNSTITLTECCCKKNNGDSTTSSASSCTPSNKKCYCCCPCDSDCSSCTSETDNSLKKCCCTSSNGQATESTQNSCQCKCAEGIKLCSCCQCIKTDKIFSCCELESKAESCTDGKCCCCDSTKKCECKCVASTINGNGNGVKCNNDECNYCCSTEHTCKSAICHIKCAMENLTNDSKLSNMIDCFKGFGNYLSRISGCNGECCCKCEGKSCCSKEEGSGCCCCKDEKVEGLKCCNVDCNVIKMYGDIFENGTTSPGSNGTAGTQQSNKVSICTADKKCSICLLCCIKKEYEKIKSACENCCKNCCKDCYNTTSTCAITNGSTTAVCTQDTQCTSTQPDCKCTCANGTCTDSSTTCDCKSCCKCDCKCECKSDCKICSITPSSLCTSIKKLYHKNKCSENRLLNIKRYNCCKNKVFEQKLSTICTEVKNFEKNNKECVKKLCGCVSSISTSSLSLYFYLISLCCCLHKTQSDISCLNNFVNHLTRKSIKSRYHMFVTRASITSQSIPDIIKFHSSTIDKSLSFVYGGTYYLSLFILFLATVLFVTLGYQIVPYLRNFPYFLVYKCAIAVLSVAITFILTGSLSFLSATYNSGYLVNCAILIGMICSLFYSLFIQWFSYRIFLYNKFKELHLKFRLVYPSSPFKKQPGFCWWFEGFTSFLLNDLSTTYSLMTLGDLSSDSDPFSLGFTTKFNSDNIASDLLVIPGKSNAKHSTNAHIFTEIEALDKMRIFIKESPNFEQLLNYRSFFHIPKSEFGILSSDSSIYHLQLLWAAWTNGKIIHPYTDQLFSIKEKALKNVEKVLRAEAKKTGFADAVMKKLKLFERFQSGELLNIPNECVKDPNINNHLTAVQLKMLIDLHTGRCSSHWREYYNETTNSNGPPTADSPGDSAKGASENPPNAHNGVEDSKKHTSAECVFETMEELLDALNTWKEERLKYCTEVYKSSICEKVILKTVGEFEDTLADHTPSEALRLYGKLVRKSELSDKVPIDIMIAKFTDNKTSKDARRDISEIMKSYDPSARKFTKSITDGYKSTCITGDDEDAVDDNIKKYTRHIVGEWIRWQGVSATHETIDILTKMYSF